MGGYFLQRLTDIIIQPSVIFLKTLLLSTDVTRIIITTCTYSNNNVC